MNNVIEIGTKVEAGKGEDRDTGVVMELDGDKALVGWDNAPEKTWTPVADLTEA